MDVSSDDDTTLTLEEDAGPNVYAYDLHDSLSRQVTYAASPLLCQRLCWIMEGSRDRLVWRYDIHKWRRDGRLSKKDIWNAELSVVGMLYPDDCWLTLRSSTIAEFQESRLICTLVAPDYGPFRDDFNLATSNLQCLMSERFAYQTSKSRVLYTDQGRVKLRVRHVPFVVRLGGSSIITPLLTSSRLTDNGAMALTTRRTRPTRISVAVRNGRCCGTLTDQHEQTCLLRSRTGLI